MTSSRMTLLGALAARYGVGAVYVFGSRAAEMARKVRGESAAAERPEADVDVAIQPLPGRRLGARQRAEFAVALEAVLDVPRVDLLILSEAEPFLALDAIRGELLFCADPDEQAESELYVLRRAGDLAPFARERWEHALGGTAA